MASSASATRPHLAPSVHDARRASLSTAPARWLFIWPTVIVILCLSLFPLIASVALSLSKLAFNKGGIDLKFIGFANYQQLLFGLERSHFLGVLKTPNPLGWLVVGATIVLVTVAWTRSVRGGKVGPFGLVLRLFAGILLVGFVYLLVAGAAERRRPPRRPDRHADLRVRAGSRSSTRSGSGSRCSRCSRCPGASSSGSCS